MNNRYDVIIIGSGPAGSSAAYFLGAQGIKVLLLEKQSLPRYKTCGGGLSIQMLKCFPFSFDPVLDVQVQKSTYLLNGDSITFNLPPQSIGMVMRDQFDAFILDHAQAIVKTNQAVAVTTELDDRVRVETFTGETFESEYLIAADGANSSTARQLNPFHHSRNAGAIEVEISVESKIHQRYAENPLFIFGAIPFGYAWIFPKKDHLSIGIAAFHPKPGQLQKILYNEMKKLGINLDSGSQHGHPIPIFIHQKNLASRRILLAGDAAGLVDPFTGEGIRFAIQSGMLAARAVTAEKISHYPIWIDHQIGRSHRMGLNLARLFYSFPEICFELGVTNPYATPTFIQMLSGAYGYPQVLLRLFATLPLHLGKEFAQVLKQSFSAGR